MNKGKWMAGLLAGALLLPGLTAEAEERAPAEPKAAASESTGWHLDESSVHVTDASGDDIMTEAIVMEADRKGRPSVRRAVYKLTGEQKDFVLDGKGQWKPVAKDSPDAARAARIRALLNDPARRAQFEAEIQQVLVKQWAEKEKARQRASAVVVTIEPAGQPASEDGQKDAAPDAEPEEADIRSGAEKPASVEAGDAQKNKTLHGETAGAETAEKKKGSPDGEGVRIPVTQEGKESSPEGAQKKDGKPEEKKPAAQEEPAVVVEITSHEPQVTIEPMPSAEIRPEPGAPARD